MEEEGRTWLERDWCLWHVIIFLEFLARLKCNESGCIPFWDLRGTDTCVEPGRE